MKKNFMFKYLSMAAVAVALTAVSCDSDENPTPEPPPASNGYSASTAVPEGYKIGFKNDATGNTYFVAEENGEITKIGFVLTPVAMRSNNTNVNGVAYFQSQQISSVTIKGVTYEFAVNNGKVNVRVGSNGTYETFLGIADASLLDGAANSEAKLEAAFAKISKATAIITQTNGKITESSLKAEVQNIAESVSKLSNDATSLANNGTATNLTNNATSNPFETDSSGIAAADSTANSNIDSDIDWGLDVDGPNVPSDTTNVDVPDFPDVPGDTTTIDVPEIPTEPGDTTGINIPDTPYEPGDSTRSIKTKFRLR